MHNNIRRITLSPTTGVAPPSVDCMHTKAPTTHTCACAPTDKTRQCVQHTLGIYIQTFAPTTSSSLNAPLIVSPHPTAALHLPPQYYSYLPTAPLPPSPPPLTSSRTKRTFSSLEAVATEMLMINLFLETSTSGDTSAPLKLNFSMNWSAE